MNLKHSHLFLETIIVKRKIRHHMSTTAYSYTFKRYSLSEPAAEFPSADSSISSKMAFSTPTGCPILYAHKRE